MPYLGQRVWKYLTQLSPVWKLALNHLMKRKGFLPRARIYSDAEIALTACPLFIFGFLGAPSLLSPQDPIWWLRRARVSGRGGGVTQCNQLRQTETRRALEGPPRLLSVHNVPAQNNYRREVAQSSLHTFILLKLICRPSRFHGSHLFSTPTMQRSFHVGNRLSLNGDWDTPISDTWQGL